MNEIEKQLYRERMEAAKTMLDLAKYLEENAKTQLVLAKDWLDKTESADTTSKAQVFLDIAELTFLEADEDTKLGILLSLKAEKLIEEAKSLL